MIPTNLFPTSQSNEYVDCNETMYYIDSLENQALNRKKRMRKMEGSQWQYIFNYHGVSLFWVFLFL